ncbi:hypothetical protein [Ochrobactrum sp. MYb379]|uniref:hypothetical protein n=1 Tax=Ochrobactrum sp. MYb379 TaxID=2745275 RepID=UPI0030B4EF5C
MPRRPHLTSGVSQGINEAASGLSHQAGALRKKLCDGNAIVDLDKETMEAFFVSDRLQDYTSTNLNALFESIRENGKTVPIVTCPHPDKTVRYQLVYGNGALQFLINGG